MADGSVQERLIAAEIETIRASVHTAAGRLSVLIKIIARPDDLDGQLSEALEYIEYALDYLTPDPAMDLGEGPCCPIAALTRSDVEVRS